MLLQPLVGVFMPVCDAAGNNVSVYSISALKVAGKWELSL